VTIPMYGASGAAWSSLAAYTAMAALAHWQMRRANLQNSLLEDTKNE
jgi:cytochrome oxidase assembly protein ShyY1